ncbi:MAG: alkaline phosphatase family protein [Candidatus Eisenbacteria bacterium]
MNTAPPDKKTFILAVDGGTFDVIRPLVKRGKLPNMGRLMKQGSWGKLHSTIHPITPAAWTSFMTGVNPGRHGVYDFVAPEPSGYGFRLTTALNCREETFWSYLSRHGKRVIAVNLPFTYPPERVNGLMISGLDAPMARREIASPPEVYDTLVGQFGEYIMDWTMPVGRRFNLARYKENLWRTLEFRYESGRYLLSNYPWDCFMLVFNSTDHVQHIFWQAEPEARSIIEETYQRVDGYLGKFLEELDNDTTVLIVSDHGAGPIERVFYLDRWLEREGYLVFSSSTFSPGRVLVGLARKARTFLRRHLPVPVKKMLRYALPGTRDRVETLIATRNVDWSRVKAYSSGYYGNIYINLRGDKPKGTVSAEDYDMLCSELSDKLMQIEDPSTGERIVERVYRKNDIYSGEQVRHAPDLIIRWRDYATYTEKGLEAASGDDTDSLFAGRHLKVESSDYPLTGTHRIDGIFIAAGPAIRQSGEVEKLNILDLFPTILYTLGRPIPDDRDGRVLEEIFDPAYLAEHPPDYVPADRGPSTRDTATGGLNEDEEAAIAERLRGLGYLG